MGEMILLDDLRTATASCFGQRLKDQLLRGRRGRGITCGIVRPRRIKPRVTRSTELVQNQALRDAGKVVEGTDELRRLRFQGPEQQIIDPSHKCRVHFALWGDDSEEHGPSVSSQVTDVLLGIVEGVGVAKDASLRKEVWSRAQDADEGSTKYLRDHELRAFGCPRLVAAAPYPGIQMVFERTISAPEGSWSGAAALQKKNNPLYEVRYW